MQERHLSLLLKIIVLIVLLLVQCLGIALKTISSVPVGYERIVEMFSLDFEEFLWAPGDKDVRKTIPTNISQ